MPGIATSRADRAHTAAADLGALCVESLIGDPSANDWVGELVDACVTTARQRFPQNNAYLHALGALTEIAEAVRGHINDVVASAKIAGASPSDIDSHLRMSRPAAFEHWT